MNSKQYTDALHKLVQRGHYELVANELLDSYKDISNDLGISTGYEDFYALNFLQKNITNKLNPEGLAAKLNEFISKLSLGEYTKPIENKNLPQLKETVDKLELEFRSILWGTVKINWNSSKPWMIGLFMLVLLLVAGGFIGYSVSNNTPISKNSINQCYIINKKLEYCVDAIYNVKYKINEIKEETSKMDVTNDLLNKYENQKTILEYQIIPRLKNIDTLQCGTQEGKNIEKQVDSLLNIVGL